MSEFGLNRVGPLEFTTDSMDHHSEFLLEIFGDDIETPADYAGLELEMGKISDEDFFFNANMDPDVPMEPTSIIEQDDDRVPFDGIDTSEIPPPIYVCNREDSIQSPKSNGDILFNLILAIAIEYDEHLKRNDSLLHKILKDERKKVMDTIGTCVTSENMVLFNVRYRELEIKRTSIVKMLNLVSVQTLFGKKVPSPGTIQGIVVALNKKIDKSDVKKIEYKNVPKNSVFIVRVKC